MKKFMGKAPLIVLLVLVCLTLIKIIDHHNSQTVFTTQNPKDVGDYWRSTKSVLIDSQGDTFPIVFPGPMEKWAGAGPKELSFATPYGHAFSFTLKLKKSSFPHPPLLEIFADTIKIGEMQIDNKLLSYSFNVKDERHYSKDTRIILRCVKGSGLAIDRISFTSVPRSWEIWKYIPIKWAYYLLILCVILLVILFLGRVYANRVLRGWVINILLLAVSCSATLIAVELVMRNFFPQPLHETDVRIVYIADEKIGYRLKPNMKTAVGFNTNSLGMRDYDRYTQKKPENTFRILCIGDSFTYSITRMQDSYPKYLERFLQKKYDHIEVLNAGGSGYGTKEEYAYFKAYGLEFEPDLVILGFYVGNDITDTHPTRNLTAVNGSLVTKETAERLSAESISWEKRKKEFLNQIHLYRLVKSRDYKELFDNFDENLTKALERKNKRLSWCLRPGPSGVYRNTENYSKIIKESWDNTVIHLEKITRLAKENNIGLAIALIPSEIQFDHEEAIKVKENMRNMEGGDTYNWAYPQRGLMNLAKERGWPMFDAIDGMKEEGSGETFYFCRDPHFNENGNRAFAKALEKWVVDHYGDKL